MGIETRDVAVANLQASKAQVQSKLYEMTDSMVEAQQHWGEAETKLKRLQTEVAEFEEMTGEMSLYVDGMYEYQEDTVSTLDHLKSAGSSSRYLSSKANSGNAADRRAASRYFDRSTGGWL